MKNKIDVESLIFGLKSNEFIKYSPIPMGYVPGLPLLCVRNGYLCLLVPYLKYKVTGVVDQTLVYPPRFVVTLKVPENIIVGFEDLSFHTAFENVNFAASIGLFRHEAIQHLDKQAYSAKRSQLFTLYDAIIESLEDGICLDKENELNMKQLLSILLEPAVKPFYQAIDKDFYFKYIDTK